MRLPSFPLPSSGCLSIVNTASRTVRVCGSICTYVPAYVRAYVLLTSSSWTDKRSDAFHPIANHTSLRAEHAHGRGVSIGHAASPFTSESRRHSGHGICTAIIPQPVGQQRRIGSRTEIHWVPQLTPKQSVSLLEPWVQPCVTHSKTQMCVQLERINTAETLLFFGGTV